MNLASAKLITFPLTAYNNIIISGGQDAMGEIRSTSLSVSDDVPIIERGVPLRVSRIPLRFLSLLD